MIQKKGIPLWCSSKGKFNNSITNFSHLLPLTMEDEQFKKFLRKISDTKTKENIKLMKFLYQRKTPRSIDLIYEQFQ